MPPVATQKTSLVVTEIQVFARNFVRIKSGAGRYVAGKSVVYLYLLEG